MLAIDSNILMSKLNSKQLDEDGYNLKSIDFSKGIKSLLLKNIDPWVISSDNKLLHWGPICSNKEEYNNMREDAEKYVNKKTGLSRKKISYSDKNKLKNWYNLYVSYINNQFVGVPFGWYQSDEINLNDIIKNSIKI